MAIHKTLESALSALKQRIIKQYGNAKTIDVEAGIFEDATSTKTNTSVAEYAAYNEYGTVHIPARPFMRTAFKTRSKDWKEQFKRNVQRGHNLAKCTSVLKVVMEDDIRRSIDGDFEKWTPNKQPKRKQTDFTLKGRKTGTKHNKRPLIDTTTMYKAITSKVSIK